MSNSVTNVRWMSGVAETSTPNCSVCGSILNNLTKYGRVFGLGSNISPIIRERKQSLLNSIYVCFDRSVQIRFINLTSNIGPAQVSVVAGNDHPCMYLVLTHPNPHNPKAAIWQKMAVIWQKKNNTGYHPTSPCLQVVYDCDNDITGKWWFPIYVYLDVVYVCDNDLTEKFWFSTSTEKWWCHTSLYLDVVFVKTLHIPDLRQ